MTVRQRYTYNQCTQIQSNNITVADLICTPTVNGRNFRLKNLLIDIPSGPQDT